MINKVSHKCTKSGCPWNIIVVSEYHYFCYSMLTLSDQVSDWNLVNESGTLKLSRSWKVKSFNKGLEFFRIIADLAEAEGICMLFCYPSMHWFDVIVNIRKYYNAGHHPDLHLVGWNNVTVEIWTHSVGMYYSFFTFKLFLSDVALWKF